VLALQVLAVLEWEWQAAGDSQCKKMGVAQIACFVFFGYARALRGEEIPKIELTGVIKYFAGATTNPPPPYDIVSDWSIKTRGGRATAF
jgi:hypothetical protein